MNKTFINVAKPHFKHMVVRNTKEVIETKEKLAINETLNFRAHVIKVENLRVLFTLFEFGREN